MSHRPLYGPTAVTSVLMGSVWHLCLWLDTAANRSELRNPVDVHAKLKLVILFF